MEKEVSEVEKREMTIEGAKSKFLNMWRDADHEGKVWLQMCRERSFIPTEGRQSKWVLQSRVDDKFDGGKISQSFQVAFQKLSAEGKEKRMALEVEERKIWGANWYMGGGVGKLPFDGPFLPHPLLWLSLQNLYSFSAVIQEHKILGLVLKDEPDFFEKL